MDSQHHYGWMAVVVFMFLVCVWIYASNRPDQYQKGSVHIEDHGFSVVSIGKGGCATMDAMKGPKNVKNSPVAVSPKH